MKLTVEGLEKERDFYFGKLRDIEVICQEHENANNPVLCRILDTLYATEVNKNHTTVDFTLAYCLLTWKITVYTSVYVNFTVSFSTGRICTTRG